MPDTDLDKTYDVLVIGSGAAGSIAVKELTGRGLQVLLLEAGPELRERDFVPPSSTSHDPFSLDITARATAFLRGQFERSSLPLSTVSWSTIERTRTTPSVANPSSGSGVGCSAAASIPTAESSCACPTWTSAPEAAMATPKTGPSRTPISRRTTPGSSSSWVCIGLGRIARRPGRRTSEPAQTHHG